ncbi:MAG: hypothetical protein QF864_06280 [SAR202 cluster bacterium]|nr:hypothetical protein [SAR202 cluster bacterium]
MYLEVIVCILFFLVACFVVKLSKKIFYLTLMITVSLLALFLVTGCGGGDALNLRSKIENIEDNTVTRIGDLPFIKGTKIDISKSIIFGEGMSWSGQLSVYVPKKKIEVFNYYVRNLNNYSWKEQTTIRGETSVLNYLGPNNRVAIITIQQGKFGPSNATISVSPFTEKFEEALGDSIKEKYLDIEDFVKN